MEKEKELGGNQYQKRGDEKAEQKAKKKRKKEKQNQFVCEKNSHRGKEPDKQQERAKKVHSLHFTKTNMVRYGLSAIIIFLELNQHTCVV